MPRNSIRSIAAIGFWIAACAQSVFAHAVSISHGSVLVHPDRIRLELKIAAEDFAHYYGIGIMQRLPWSLESLEWAADRHGHSLVDAMVIRNGQGERLPGRLVSKLMTPLREGPLNPDQIRSLEIIYVIEYANLHSPGLLSFQLLPITGSPGLLSQSCLNVRLSGTDESRSIRLTSGGNVETLQFSWPRDGSRPTITGPLEGLKSVLARMEIAGDELRFEVDVPLPLLETFVPFDRVNREFIEVEDQRAAESRLQSFFLGRNDISIDGRLSVPDSAGVVWLEPGSSESTRSTFPRRLGVWTTRVRWSQRFELNKAPTSVTLHWDLFNAAVLQAEITLQSDNSRSIHRVSTYAPALHWTRQPDSSLFKNSPLAAGSPE